MPKSQLVTGWTPWQTSIITYNLMLQIDQKVTASVFNGKLSLLQCPMTISVDASLILTEKQTAYYSFVLFFSQNIQAETLVACIHRAQHLNTSNLPQETTANQLWHSKCLQHCLLQFGSRTDSKIDQGTDQKINTSKSLPPSPTPQPTLTPTPSHSPFYPLPKVERTEGNFMAQKQSFFLPLTTQSSVMLQ